MRKTAKRTVETDNGLLAVETRDYHVIVYVKACSDSLRRFYRTCIALAILSPRSDDNGKPIAVQTDASLTNGGRFDIAHIVNEGLNGLLAFELFIPIQSWTQFLSYGDDRADCSDVELGRKLFLASYHLVDSARIPAGMGKLSGMQEASVKLSPIDHGTGRSKTTLKTAVQHGRGKTKIVKPTLSSELQKESREYPKLGGLRSDNVIIRETDESGKLVSRVVHPIKIPSGDKRVHAKQTQFGNAKPTGKTAIALPSSHGSNGRDKTAHMPTSIYLPRWIDHVCI